jgi:hypothetical protein
LRFLASDLSADEARGQLAQVAGGSVSVIDRLQDILSVPEEPLPDVAPPSPAISSVGGRQKSRAWTNEEDLRLLAGIRRFGPASSSNWSSVASFVGSGRTRSQCSQRWIRVLDPRISRDVWRPEEERRVMALVALYGEKAWMKIASEMGNRSDVQCRYHYIQAKRSRGLPRADRPPPLPVDFSGAEAAKDDTQVETEIPLANALDLCKSDSLFDSTFALF